VRATAEWLAGDRGWVAMAKLAGALVAAPLIPGGLGGTSTGSASMLPNDRLPGRTRPNGPPTGHPGLEPVSDAAVKSGSRHSLTSGSAPGR
jgi:hypothetical protein